MYEPYSTLNLPSSDATVWRYMSFSKLKRLLDDGGLYFCRQDLFVDPKEGSTPDPAQDRTHQELHKQNAPAGLSSSVIGLKDSMAKRIYISCWREDEDENAGMWDLYGGEDKGDCIAIKTTIGELINSISDARKFHAGRVEYVDLETHVQDDGDIMKQACLKRLAFKNEQEIRLLHHVPGASMGSMADYMKGEKETGHVFSVDLNLLLKAVIIHPEATEQYVADCRALLQVCDASSCFVTKSSLYG